MDYNNTLYDDLLEFTTGRDSPESVVDIFVRLANTLTPPKLIDGEVRKLRPQDIEHSAAQGEPTENQMFVGGNLFGRNLGALFWGSTAFVGLLVNYRWWDFAEPEARLVFLLHELSHLEQKLRYNQSGHSPVFWELSREIYQNAKENRIFIEALFEAEFDWDRTDWYFITMPNVLNVDLNEEAVPERRQKLADSLGQSDSFDALKLTANQIKVRNYEGTVQVPLESINAEPATNTEVYDSLKGWLSSHESPVTVNPIDLLYHVEPPTVTKTDADIYEVVLGNTRVEFLKRTIGVYHETPTISVYVAE